MELLRVKASYAIKIDKLGKPLVDPVCGEGTVDHDMASRAEAAEQNFGRRCRERRQDLRDIGWAKIDQFQWVGFKHETQELLIRLSLQNNGLSIKAIIQ